MAILNPESSAPFEEVFKYDNRKETLYDGGLDMQDITSIVNNTVLRDTGGRVIGLVEGLMLGDGDVVTPQGDKFTVTNTGEIAEIKANPAITEHEVNPIETKILNGIKIGENSYQIEVASPSAKEAFGGEIQSNQPMIWIPSAERGIEPRIVIAGFMQYVKEIGNGPVATGTTTTHMELYDPLVESGIKKTGLGEGLGELMDAVRTHGGSAVEMRAQETRYSRRNLVGTIGTKTGEVDPKELFYITDIAPLPADAQREDATIPEEE